MFSKENKVYKIGIKNIHKSIKHILINQYKVSCELGEFYNALDYKIKSVGIIKQDNEYFIKSFICNDKIIKIRDGMLNSNKNKIFPIFNQSGTKILQFTI